MNCLPYECDELSCPAQIYLSGNPTVEVFLSQSLETIVGVVLTVISKLPIFIPHPSLYLLRLISFSSGFPAAFLICNVKVSNGCQFPEYF